MTRSRSWSSTQRSLVEDEDEALAEEEVLNMYVVVAEVAPRTRRGALRTARRRRSAGTAGRKATTPESAERRPPMKNVEMMDRAEIHAEEEDECRLILL